MSLEEKRLKLEARAHALDKASTSKALEVEEGIIIQLPLWSDPKRAVPNGVLRSALFGVVGRGRRRYLKSESIACLDGVKILYTGERLDQTDLDIWECCLQIARDQPLGTPIEISSYGFLKSIGRSTGKSQREWMKRSALRLGANMVEIKQGRWTYAGSLVDEFYRDEITGRYVINLNPKLASLFQADIYTQIEWEERKALQGKPLAQWLHGFYSSHAKPFPYKISTLYELSGSEEKSRRSFKQTLTRALEALENTTGWKWKIEDDKVFIDRQPSASQNRHLLKRLQVKK